MIGGGAKGEVWLQIFADIWQKTLLVPEYLEESTSMGAAVCGGVGAGIFNDFKFICKFNAIKKEIKPRKEYGSMYDKLYSIFNNAYDVLVPVYAGLNSK